MRIRFLAILVLSLAAALAGCGGNTASTKAAKATPYGREDLMIKMAYAAESGGDMGTAERLFTQAAELSDSSVESREALAKFYERHHQERRAITVLSEALKIQPKNMDILRDLANAHITIGEPEKALALLDPAIAADGKNALLHNSRGVALDRMGRFEEAQKSYETAISLDPGDAMTFEANLSMSYILSGSYDNAIHLL